MKCYKLEIGTDVVGIATHQSLVKLQLRHNILIPSDELECQFIRTETLIYRDDSWMQPIDDTKIDFSYELADVIEITAEEYYKLKEELDKKKSLEEKVKQQEQDILNAQLAITELYELTWG